MRCPYCENPGSRVLDSRSTEDGYSIRRRRECEKCQKRFTTYEKIEAIIIMVVKKDGSREIFDSDKITKGIIKACEKRPVKVSQIEKIVSKLEKGISNTMEKEISSTYIGEFIMDELKELDQVAYVRFASVYRQFTDINTFIAEIEGLISKNK